MKYNFDLTIIGGGAAGMMAAISARRHHPDFNIAIVDKTFALGRKILVCGAGRCNVTNVNLDKSISSHYYGADSDFIESIISQFGYKKIVDFFSDLGVELYVERKTSIGKLFPVTDQAKTITEMLMDEIQRSEIDIFLNTKVESLINNKKSFVLECEERTKEGILESKFSIESKYVILSAGGKTYPAYGSDGSGYKLAQAFGHKLINPVPSALSIESKNPLSHELQGTKMEMEVTSIIDNKEIKSRVDDVMFKQYGLSGPAILNISREISIHFNRENKNNCQIKLNFFPGKSLKEITTIMKKRWSKRPDQTIEKSMYGIFPNKIPASLLKLVKINKDKLVKDLLKSEITNLINLLGNTRIVVNGTRGWNEAEFTAGGIDTKDVNKKTLESNMVKNLYLAGEILNVDGDVGGFNLSWSWASGFIAGKLL